MVRLLIVFVAATLFTSTNADAQLFGRKWFGGRKHSSAKRPAPNNYRTPYPTTSAGISVGFGSYPYYNYPRPGSFDPYRFDSYVYDPYRSGSFRAPDLINDPYFRERHRYDSHFPGRRKPPLVLRSTVPASAYPLDYGYPRNYRSTKRVNPYSGSIALQRPGAFPDPSHLEPWSTMPRAPSRNSARPDLSAPEQLARNLSSLQDGEAWIEFLVPNRVRDMIAHGESGQLSELLSRYDGITNNPEMASIVAITGFQETRSLLRQYVGPSVEPTPLEIEETQPLGESILPDDSPLLDEPKVELLPPPEPEKKSDTEAI